jgi:hypothetical protein
MPMLMTVRMRLPLWPRHWPLRTCVGKRCHAAQHGVHFGHDIDAVHQNLRALGRAQGRVQGRAVLGGVDGVAAKHGGDALAHAALLGQLEQQAQGVVRDALF